MAKPIGSAAVQILHAELDTLLRQRDHHVRQGVELTAAMGATMAKLQKQSEQLGEANLKSMELKEQIAAKQKEHAATLHLDSSAKKLPLSIHSTFSELAKWAQSDPIYHNEFLEWARQGSVGECPKPSVSYGEADEVDDDLPDAPPMDEDGDDGKEVEAEGVEPQPPAQPPAENCEPYGPAAQFCPGRSRPYTLDSVSENGPTILIEAMGKIQEFEAEHPPRANPSLPDFPAYDSADY
jgi:hypothetical protein